MTHQHLPADDVVERLRGTPLFGGLDDERLARLIERGEIVDLAPGDRLIGEGEVADALYVILDGEFDVTKRSGAAEIPLARVGPGALQGEIAALEGGRRLASVRAVTAGEVLRIPVGRHPRAARMPDPTSRCPSFAPRWAACDRWRRRSASARSLPHSAHWPPAWRTS